MKPLIESLVNKSNIKNVRNASVLCIVYCSWTKVNEKIVHEIKESFNIYAGNKLLYSIIRKDNLEKAKSYITNGTYIIYQTNTTHIDEVISNLNKITCGRDILKFSKIIEEC